MELCRFFDRCSPDILELYAGGSVQDCIDFERCSAPDEGWVVSEQCIQTIRDADCDVDWVHMIYRPPCDIGGSLPFAKEGESCNNSVCRPGTVPTQIYCDEGLVCTEDDVCVPAIPKGEPCKIDLSPGWHADLCEEGAFCDGSTCREYLREGDSCSLINGPEDELDPCPNAASLYCYEGVCATPKYDGGYRDLGAGEPCSLDEERCHYGLTCHEGVCTPLTCPGAKEDLCDTETCGSGLICNRGRARCESIGVDCYDPHTDQYLPCPDGLTCSDWTETCQLPG